MKIAQARSDNTPLMPAPPWRWSKAQWRERLTQYALLTRQHRPVGWLLLLWPTYWALWLAADGFPPWPVLIIFTLGVVMMRSAGCVINDYADRWLDPHVERTRDRPLATGKVAPREALYLFVLLMLLAFGLVLLTNQLTIYLSLVAAAMAAVYPFLKRYTYLPQMWLGAAFGWSVPMAFAAVAESLPPLCWLLFIGNVVWTTAYDSIYAMVDRDDDLAMGAKSSAILFGDLDRAMIGITHALFLLAMLFVGLRAELSNVYFYAWGLAAMLVVTQLWAIRHRDRDACFRAFLSNQWLGAVIFAGIAGHYWLN